MNTMTAMLIEMIKEESISISKGTSATFDLCGFEMGDTVNEMREMGFTVLTRGTHMSIRVNEGIGQFVGGAI